MPKLAEFPMLQGAGLYAASILGDGNCLFNALSDQIYGNEKGHKEIRARVIEYMRENADYYKKFIVVHPGGGTRRNPKRKNTAPPPPTVPQDPTPAEIDRAFEKHLKEMARGGTWGDNLEINAFVGAYGTTVVVHQKTFSVTVSRGEESEDRPVAHVAYHDYQHYSSVRNIKGPHEGLPELVAPPEDLYKDEKSLGPEELAQVVLNSLPFVVDPVTITKFLAESGGSVNAAVDKILAAEERGSSRGSPSSIERDYDSDEEAMRGQSKKQNRGRAIKPAKKGKGKGKGPTELVSVGTPNSPRVEALPPSLSPLLTAPLAPTSSTPPPPLTIAPAPSPKVKAPPTPAVEVLPAQKPARKSRAATKSRKGKTPAKLAKETSSVESGFTPTKGSSASEAEAPKALSSPKSPMRRLITGRERNELQAAREKRDAAAHGAATTKRRQPSARKQAAKKGEEKSKKKKPAAKGRKKPAAEKKEREEKEEEKKDSSMLAAGAKSPLTILKGKTRDRG
ncbi:MAG: hypothetical protein M1829_004857 [Trizodia sp. TS-e1964]|nr:MAG: hypothetical protein M1829_004857 [Trizodia sp. TS-e1964]